jgi:hypothetical protein
LITHLSGNHAVSGRIKPIGTLQVERNTRNSANVIFDAGEESECISNPQASGIVDAGDCFSFGGAPGVCPHP